MADFEGFLEELESARICAEVTLAEGGQPPIAAHSWDTCSFWLI